MEQYALALGIGANTGRSAKWCPGSTSVCRASGMRVPALASQGGWRGARSRSTGYSRATIRWTDTFH